ncbi:MAG TPA: hypothetical protein VGW39_15115 [Chthoniobacterales bacterium]|nr:hypothetical protein [Chthoniobacterales bacterium]
MRITIPNSSCFPAFLLRFDLAAPGRRAVVIAVVLLAFLALARPLPAQSSSNPTPFGQISEVDVDQLMKFGRARDFDLQPEMDRIYQKDEEALARLFRFSLKFKKFDRKARTYGQIMYGCWLKFGELYGVDLYLKVLDRQPDEVQQRVRDFLYYPLLRMPKEKRKENLEEIRRMYPRLYPTDYHFGRNDPIF